LSQFDLDLSRGSDLLENVGELKESTTHKQLSDAQLKTIVDYIVYLDSKLKLCDLEHQTIEDDFINEELPKVNELKRKHIKQISSIVSHVNLVLNKSGDSCSSSCVVELGAGRGKLSLWFQKSRTNSKIESPRISILLIERGSQKHKVDSTVKKEGHTELERIRIDLKDLFINKCPIIERADNFLCMGKHLCGKHFSV
jgi:hypothetical protein